MSSKVTFVDRPGGAPLVVAFDQLAALGGRSFVGDWFSVEAGRLSLFDHAAYTDENPHPLPLAGYPDEMIEGFHLLSLLDHLMNHVLYLDGPDAFGWNYGFDRVRFVTPIRAGEAMRLSGSLATIKPKNNGFLVRADCEVEVKEGGRPGFVAQWWVNWLPVPPDSINDVVQQAY